MGTLYYATRIDRCHLSSWEVARCACIRIIDWFLLIFWHNSPWHICDPKNLGRPTLTLFQHMGHKRVIMLLEWVMLELLGSGDMCLYKDYRLVSAHISA